MAGRLRIAILSTPRSGNTWLRHLLATAYDLEHLAVDRPGDLAWEDLPDRFVLQLHWPRVGPLASLLERHRVRVAVIARHPLDVLISLLSWVDNCPGPRTIWEESPCLDGDQGDESPLFGATPTDDAFLAYATGPRARALMDVGLRWWHAPDALKVRYEDLVAHPASTLGGFLADVGEEPRLPVPKILAANSLEGLRDRHAARSLHFWQGSPGLWRSLIPAGPAGRIEAELGDVFSTFGYACDPDETLTADRASANWYRLQLTAARSALDRLRASSCHGPAGDGGAAGLRDQLDHAHRLLYEERVAHEQLQARCAATTAQLEGVLKLLYEERSAREPHPAH